MREEKKAVAKSLGEALKENRIRCQMTQEFVAETLCVSRQSVSTWENGFSDPNTSNLIALAKLYKISPEQLLEYAAGMPDGESNIPPYACCAPSSAAPVPVQGRPPFGNTDGSAPAVILNTKFLRHMFLFVLKWQ